MKLSQKPSARRDLVLLLVVFLAPQGGMSAAAEPAVSESAAQPEGLMGDWCRVKKRKVTHYSVKEGTLFIRSGRSGQTFEANLTCNDAYTECEAKTIRGWGTPVTEILRLDGKDMNLTRIWGGAWKDKTYNFAYTRCPKW